MEPEYIVSTPVDKKDGKTFWLRIGAGWKKTEGISIELNALPINGKLFLGKPKPKEKTEPKVKVAGWM